MKNSIWSKHIPTLLGIAIITIGIAVTSFLVKNGTIVISEASPAETPQNVKISNISDSSFTVSYTTLGESLGSVNFGKDKNLGQAAFDERDQKENLVTPHKIHMITVKNLTPQTRYYFSIASGQKLYLDNGVPFEVSTGPIIENQAILQAPMTGKIILPNAELPKEAIVYATADKSQIISTLMKDDGSYTLELNTMRLSDLSSFSIYDESSIIKILIENEILKSNVSASALQESLPAITLSNDYDLTQKQSAITPVATESAQIFGFPSIAVSEDSGTESANSPKITLPKKDQEFSDQQPQFTGKALPNETVTITIHSPEEIQTQVTADASGVWKYRPTSPLSPGEHTLTIVTRDALGILKTITQSFTVYAQGSQVNQSATPSATPTLALLPTPTSTASSTTTPTPTPTPFPIASPTPISTLSATPIPTIAPPGNPSVLTVGILGLATAAIGLMLFLLTRKGASI
jgi:hypothetical protein